MALITRYELSKLMQLHQTKTIMDKYLNVVWPVFNKTVF